MWSIVVSESHQVVSVGLAVQLPPFLVEEVVLADGQTPLLLLTTH